MNVEVSPAKLVEKVNVTFTLAGDYELPSVQKSTIPGIAYDFVFPKTPRIEEAQQIVRQLEAQLCVLGVDSIATESPGVEWLPETHLEEGSLQVFGRSSHTKGVPTEAHTLWRHAVLKAALNAPAPEPHLSIQLAFHRAGWAEVKRFRYVEAFVFFFLFIEGLFGDSAIKKDGLIDAFLSSQELVGAIEQALQKKREAGTIPQQETWNSLDVPGAIERLVNLRGFLLHNPRERKQKWHPERQDDHADDTMFLADICNQIAMERLWPRHSKLFPAFAVIFDSDRLRFDAHLSRSADDT